MRQPGAPRSGYLLRFMVQQKLSLAGDLPDTRAHRRWRSAPATARTASSPASFSVSVSSSSTTCCLCLPGPGHGRAFQPGVGAVGPEYRHGHRRRADADLARAFCRPADSARRCRRSGGATPPTRRRRAQPPRAAPRRVVLVVRLPHLESADAAAARSLSGAANTGASSAVGLISLLGIFYISTSSIWPTSFSAGRPLRDRAAVFLFPDAAVRLLRAFRWRCWSPHSSRRRS